MEKPDSILTLEKHLNQSLTPFADWPSFLQSGARNAFLADSSGALLALDLHLEKAAALDLSAFALPMLRWLNLSENKKLQTLVLPASLPELVHLDASQCALEKIEIPADAFSRQFFGEMPRTVPGLYLQKNKLRTVDFDGGCRGLELLDLSGNGLGGLKLPDGMKRLAYLYLRENQLETLFFPHDLPELVVLDLSQNKLSVLPEVKSSTGAFLKLETLYVKSNPLKYEEALIAGDESGNAVEIIGILRAMAKSGSRPNYRAKLIIVGNGRIGKTCLVNRLLGKPCLDDQIFTHAISIQQITKEHLPDVITPQLDLQVWDFGGQDVYFATHQFFLSEEASYVYVWTDEVIARKNREKDKHPSPALYDKWQKHDYWLDNIRMHGLKSPILIVKTHCLESKEVLPFEDLRGRYELTNEPLDFDAMSVEPRYLERLRDELCKVLDALPLLGADIPISYDEVIAAIRQRKKEKEEKELSKLEFFKLVQPLKIAETDLDSLLGYLKKTGEIIYFPDNEKLKERIFIDPQALIQKVYKLLENNEFLKAHEGKFTSQFAEQTFGWVDWEVLMELLVSFELVYEKKAGKDKMYIAPQYLPELPSAGNQHDIFEGHKKEKKWRFSLKYPRFLPENVMINVLSKYGPYSLEAVYRNGIYFMKEGAGESCLIECDEKEEIISVYANENEAADRVAKEVFEQFIGLSKKAAIYLSIDGTGWIDARVAREAFEKQKDIPFVNGGWLEEKKALAFLFGERGLELKFHDIRSSALEEEKIIVPPAPRKIMATSTRNLIVGGIIVIVILLLPIWNDGRGGRINLFGWLSIELTGPNIPPEATKPIPEKVTVIGRLSINNRQASRAQIKEVSVKNNNRVNPESLSGDQFTLRNVEIPTDKRLDIEFTFADGYKDSRVFNISEIRDGICDIGEVRVSIEMKPPKKGTGGAATPVITINNTNIIQNQVQNSGQ